LTKVVAAQERSDFGALTRFIFLPQHQTSLGADEVPHLHRARDVWYQVKRKRGQHRDALNIPRSNRF
jgi:hypothetical protein